MSYTAERWRQGAAVLDAAMPELASLFRAHAAALDQVKVLYEALDEINMMACYASEEDTDSREAMLLKIGETARAAIAQKEEP